MVQAHIRSYCSKESNRNKLPSFGKDVRTVVVSPYHLKQYNNRWFLVAKRKDFDKMSNYAIDRIEGIKETTRTFEPLDNDFDFEEFFSDVVGVSVVEGAPVENVICTLPTRRGITLQQSRCMSLNLC